METTTRIENGVTIISINTADSFKNKTGHRGLTYYKSMGKYRVTLRLDNKNHHLGFFTDINDAVALRLEAEQHRDAGDFYEWHEEMMKKRHPKRR